MVYSWGRALQLITVPKWVTPSDTQPFSQNSDDKTLRQVSRKARAQFSLPSEGESRKRHNSREGSLYKGWQSRRKTSGQPQVTDHTQWQRAAIPSLKEVEQRWLFCDWRDTRAKFHISSKITESQKESMHINAFHRQMEKEVNTALVICSGQAISKSLNDLERSLFLSFNAQTQYSCLNVPTLGLTQPDSVKHCYCSPLADVLQCKCYQRPPERRAALTHPITAETAGVTAPDLSSRTFTTWGTFFRVDSVKEVLTALRNRKKQREKKDVKTNSLLSI